MGAVAVRFGHLPQKNHRQLTNLQLEVIMFEKAKNSKAQGDIGLSQAIAYFAKEGYTVCIPLTDSQDYDLIVENGKLWRVS